MKPVSGSASLPESSLAVRLPAAFFISQTTNPGSDSVAHLQYQMLCLYRRNTLPAPVTGRNVTRGASPVLQALPDP